MPFARKNQQCAGNAEGVQGMIEQVSFCDCQRMSSAPLTICVGVRTLFI
jgi:hypothetical protein